MVIFHYRVVVLDPVLSDAVHRRGEPPLAQLTWQQLMERFVSLTYTVALSQIVLPNTRTAWRPPLIHLSPSSNPKQFPLK